MKNPNLIIIQKIFISLILGIIVGAILHNQNEESVWIISNIFSPIENIFIRMVKMTILPIVISTLIFNIANTKNFEKLSKLGIKTIIYFEIVTTIAIVFGVTLSKIFSPGSGIDVSVLENIDISDYKQDINKKKFIKNGIIEIILSLVPENIFYSITNGEMLPIIFFSVIFGIGLSSLKTETKLPFINILKSIIEVMCKIMKVVMYFAPIGVFSIITNTIATFGINSLLILSKLIILTYISIIFFITIILGYISRIFNFRILKIISFFKEEIILSFSTASSESVLSQIIKKVEYYGVPSDIANFVISTGYSFNLVGSSLYQGIATIFITQLYNIDLSLNQEIMLIITLMITSKGITGVSGMSFIVLLITLNNLNIPTNGLAFIAGVDRILDMARTTLNVLGNILAALIISKLENRYKYIQNEKCKL